MNLKEILKLRKLRGDREVIVKMGEYEKRYRVWQLEDNKNLLSKHVITEFYKPINDKYGVVLKP